MHVHSTNVQTEVPPEESDFRTAYGRPRIEVAELKQAAAGQWRGILVSQAGIPASSLDGKHHPCPWCGGTDRFRLLDIDTGAVFCNKCHNTKNGDGLAAIQRANNCDFPAAANILADHLGMHPPQRNGSERKPPDLIGLLALLKGCPRESLIVYGAKVTADGKAVEFPVYGPDGKQCSTFTIWPGAPNKSKAAKGLLAAGKPSGIFLPHNEDGTPRLPKAGEEWKVVEGCKDAAALYAKGYLVAGTNGDNLPQKFVGLFRGAHTTIIPDRTEDAEAKAQKSAARLYGVAASVKVATLPLPIDGSKGDDTRDALKQADGEAMVRRSIEEAPEWKPSKRRAKGDESQPDYFSNAETIEVEDEGDDGEQKIVRVPLILETIIDELDRRTDGWPRRVNQSLFYDGGGTINWLGSPPALFGYLNAKLGRVNWYGGVGYVGRAELFEHLRNTAKQYDAIDHLPHFPPMAGHYYACRTPEPGDGQALDGLLARYRPSTTIDGDLLKAAIATLFWGGPGGARPAFVFTSDAGRGAGKTKTAESIAYAAGGHLDISAQEDIGKIKERFLTPTALSKRVALLDNVKSHKFSSADLEGLITCRDISGRALYVGDSSRPNVVTWFITLNGVSLSNDLAQRSVIIKVDKGRNDAGWYETTLDYIDQHRQAIIADCRAFLETETTPLSSYSRWASWDRDILSRLPEPEEARQVIIDRQGESDADQDEAEIIADYFARKLDSVGYDSDRDVVRIPVGIVAQWYCNAIGERQSTTKVSRHLAQMVTEGKLPQLTKEASRANGRCFVWASYEADVTTHPANDLTSRLHQYSQLSE